MPASSTPLKFLSLVTIMAIASACSGFSATTPVTEVYRDIAVHTSSDEAQVVVFRRADSDSKICLAPSPDSSPTISEGASIALPGSHDEIAAEDATGALSLGGRNPEVLITRELLYRACELTQNIGATPQDTVKIYTLFLNAAVTIAQSQTGPGSAAVALQAAVPTIDDTTAQLSDSGDSASADSSSKPSADY